MGYILSYLVFALNFVSLSLQDTKDPLKDFCRRFGHQTCIIDRRLYIDGGLVDWNPISQNPLNYTNTWLLYNDLDNAPSGMPQLYANLSKNSTVPSVYGGVLWADEVNKVFYQYGGEFQDAPEDFTLWSYDVVYNQWNAVVNTPQDIQRVSWGAGVTVNELGLAYYIGGYLNSHNVPGWSAPQEATSGLITYDMVGNTWTNSTGPDDTGRAEGVALYIPASDKGLMVYFGGILDPYKNGTVVGSAMSTIYVYDIASTKWYTQTAGGEIPDMRRKFCAGATWADDYSSYQIYLYGGQGITNATGFDDVYILSLPSFTWIKWWPTQPGAGNPHSMLSCNVVELSQMIIIGGYFAQDQDCDTPNFWGTHNMNLGEDGPSNAIWDLYYPNITKYLVPPEVIAQIGGGGTGGATVTHPANNWDNRDLQVYFTRVPKFAARTATRSIPTPTATATTMPTASSNSTTTTHRAKSNHLGAIIGGAVGGGVGLILLLCFMLCCLHRIKKKRKAGRRSPSAGPAELPANSVTRIGFPPMEQKFAHSPVVHSGTPTYSPLQGSSPVGAGRVPSSPYQTPISPYAQQKYPQDQYFAPHPSSPPPPAGPYPQQYPQPPSPSQHQQVYPQPPSPGHQQQLHPPYDPSQHALHQQHFPPPASQPQPTPTPSNYSEASYPPTQSNTPAHFYPQPLNVPSRSVSGGTGASEMRNLKPTQGRFIEERE